MEISFEEESDRQESENSSKLEKEFEKQYPLDGICLFPVLLHDGIKEVPVVDFQQRIISLLVKKATSYHELEAELMGSFALSSEKSRSGARRLIYHHISHILKQGVLIAHKKEN